MNRAWKGSEAWIGMSVWKSGMVGIHSPQPRPTRMAAPHSAPQPVPSGTLAATDLAQRLEHAARRLFDAGGAGPGPAAGPSAAHRELAGLSEPGAPPPQVLLACYDATQYVPLRHILVNALAAQSTAAGPAWTPEFRGGLVDAVWGRLLHLTAASTPMPTPALASTIGRLWVDLLLCSGENCGPFSELSALVVSPALRLAETWSSVVAAWIPPPPGIRATPSSLVPPARVCCAALDVMGSCVSMLAEAARRPSLRPITLAAGLASFARGWITRLVSLGVDVAVCGGAASPDPPVDPHEPARHALQLLLALLRLPHPLIRAALTLTHEGPDPSPIQAPQQRLLGFVEAHSRVLRPQLSDTPPCPPSPPPQQQEGGSLTPINPLAFGQALAELGLDPFSGPEPSVSPGSGAGPGTEHGTELCDTLAQPVFLPANAGSPLQAPSFFDRWETLILTAAPSATPAPFSELARLALEVLVAVSGLDPQSFTRPGVDYRAWRSRLVALWCSLAARAIGPLPAWWPFPPGSRTPGGPAPGQIPMVPLALAAVRICITQGLGCAVENGAHGPGSGPVSRPGPSWGGAGEPPEPVAAFFGVASLFTQFLLLSGLLPPLALPPADPASELIPALIVTEQGISQVVSLSQVAVTPCPPQDIALAIDLLAVGVWGELATAVDLGALTLHAAAATITPPHHHPHAHRSASAAHRLVTSPWWVSWSGVAYQVWSTYAWARIQCAALEQAAAQHAPRTSPLAAWSAARAAAHCGGLEGVRSLAEQAHAMARLARIAPPVQSLGWLGAWLESTPVGGFAMLPRCAQAAWAWAVQLAAALLADSAGRAEGHPPLLLQLQLPLPLPPSESVCSTPVYRAARAVAGTVAGVLSHSDTPLFVRALSMAVLGDLADSYAHTSAPTGLLPLDSLARAITASSATALALVAQGSPCVAVTRAQHTITRSHTDCLAVWSACSGAARALQGVLASPRPSETPSLPQAIATLTHALAFPSPSGSSRAAQPPPTTILRLAVQAVARAVSALASTSTPPEANYHHLAELAGPLRQACLAAQDPTAPRAQPGPGGGGGLCRPAWCAELMAVLARPAPDSTARAGPAAQLTASLWRLSHLPNPVSGPSPALTPDLLLTWTVFARGLVCAASQLPATHGDALACTVFLASRPVWLALATPFLPTAAWVASRRTLESQTPQHPTGPRSPSGFPDGRVTTTHPQPTPLDSQAPLPGLELPVIAGSAEGLAHFELSAPTPSALQEPFADALAPQLAALATDLAQFAARPDTTLHPAMLPVTAYAAYAILGHLTRILTVQQSGNDAASVTGPGVPMTLALIAHSAQQWLAAAQLFSTRPPTTPPSPTVPPVPWPALPGPPSLLGLRTAFLPIRMVWSAIQAIVPPTTVSDTPWLDQAADLVTVSGATTVARGLPELLGALQAIATPILQTGHATLPESQVILAAIKTLNVLVTAHCAAPPRLSPTHPPPPSRQAFFGLAAQAIRILVCCLPYSDLASTIGPAAQALQNTLTCLIQANPEHPVRTTSQHQGSPFATALFQVAEAFPCLASTCRTEFLIQNILAIVTPSAPHPTSLAESILRTRYTLCPVAP